MTDAGRRLALDNAHAQNLEPSMMFMVVMFMMHTTEHNITQQNTSEINYIFLRTKFAEHVTLRNWDIFT